MGSVTGVANGLAYLTQSGGLLSNLPASVSTSALQSASPEDIVTLSAAALQAQEVDGIFGISAANQTTIGLPALESETTGTSALPGVSSADLNNRHRCSSMRSTARRWHCRKRSNCLTHQQPLLRYELQHPIVKYPAAS